MTIRELREFLLQFLLPCIVATMLCVVIVTVPASVFAMWNNANFREGYEITVQGRVETHKLSYSVGPWWKYPYTKIVLRTLSEESYTLELYGHHEFDVNSIYRITFTRISPLGHHVFLIGKMINVEPLS